MSDPLHEIYAEELAHLGLGYALWRPSPQPRAQLEIGDIWLPLG